MFRLFYDSGYKGHFTAVEVKKGRGKLWLIHFNAAISPFLIDVYVKILSIYFSILTPSHPTQSWLIYFLLFNNTKSKKRGRKKKIKHHYPQLEGSHPRVKARILEIRLLKFIFQNYIQYHNSNNSGLKVFLALTFHHAIWHALFNFRYLSHTLQFFLTTVTLNFLFTTATDITFWNYISFSVYEYFLQVPYSHIEEVLQIHSNL